jgi:hypothetical protein
MAKNNKKSLLLIIIFLLSVTLIPMHSTASAPCTASGWIYIQGVIMAPDQIILDLPDEDLIADIFEEGFYIIDFNGIVGESGVFYVTIDGATFIAEETIIVQEGVINYDIDLHVITNNPPNMPIDPIPENDTQGVSIDPILNVNVSDPDGGLLNVYFYNAFDDSLIGTDENVTSGETANVTWSSLDYLTVYEWYAIANDSEFENKSEIWSFKTKARPIRRSYGRGNEPPIADASESQRFGVVNESIEFDGSKSIDKDGRIVDFEWDFGDGNTGMGKIITHIYSRNGSYNVTLIVTDDDGEQDEDVVNVLILKANNPPENLVVDGPLSGKQNIEYTYTASATDADTDDMLRYIFDWGDGTSTTSEVVESGVQVNATHNWTTYGEYKVKVTAEDNVTAQTSTTLTVLIDVIVIDDEIQGYLADEDSNDPYDIFDNSDTGEQTSVEKQEDNETYLIDSDGDGKWDHAYSPGTGVITYYEFVYQKYYTIYKATPGFELMSLIVVIALVFIILKVRKKK